MNKKTKFVWNVQKDISALELANLLVHLKFPLTYPKFWILPERLKRHIKVLRENIS